MSYVEGNQAPVQGWAETDALRRWYAIGYACDGALMQLMGIYLEIEANGEIDNAFGSVMDGMDGGKRFFVEIV